jgi:hypothetical protein
MYNQKKYNCSNGQCNVNRDFNSIKQYNTTNTNTNTVNRNMSQYSTPVSNRSISGYRSRLGFNFDDKKSLQKAYGILKNLVSPEKKVYYTGAYNTAGSYTSATTNNYCQGNSCNTKSIGNTEYCSRGNTTPY